MATAKKRIVANTDTQTTAGKPYDTSLKSLLRINPKDWVSLLDLPQNTAISELTVW